MKKPVALLAFIFLLGMYPAMDLKAQSEGSATAVDRNAVFAREEFRRGVQAYNRYAFNEAILSFEKALSYRPSEALILEWLGRSYYRSGLENTALRQWEAALALKDPMSASALLLNGRIETVRNRRSLFPDLDEYARYVETGRYPGKSGSITVYSQPSSILPAENGSAWVVAYGSNEVVRIDVNGIVRQRIRGPMNGFDRPYDIARGADGSLYVSEYRGGRISVLDARGEWKRYIGSKGRGNGEFVGPQNLAVDEEGYLYVVDYGTRRVSKFHADGSFLFSFGAPKGLSSGSANLAEASRAGYFPGFIAPTGIAAAGNAVYVSDGGSRRIYHFDRSGNYLGVVAESTFLGLEGLRLTEDGKLLVADTRRVLMVDPDTGLVTELGSLGNDSVRITCADVDGNGNILAADFRGNEVSVMARMDDIAAGLFVELERVISDDFPEVTIEVRVQDRRRRPVIGLEARNFLITEENAPVLSQSFLGAAHLTQKSDVSLLVERSVAIQTFRGDLDTALGDITASVDRIVSVVSSGEQPVKETIESSPELRNAVLEGRSPASPHWRFDLGLRLAATDLLNGEKKRAVVFISTGSLGEKAFERYGLAELASYMANNGIRFYVVLLGRAKPDKELEYLAQETGGQILPLYRSAGIQEGLSQLRYVAEGSYQLKYTSQLPTDFGRAYLPVETEVYLLDRSGRDAIGYFPPLE